MLGTVKQTDGDRAGFYTLAQKSGLSQTVAGVDVDYQYFDEFDRTVAAAKEVLDQGNGEDVYDGTLWDEFSSAYDAAVAVRDDANANQNEIDWFAGRLSTAQQDMVDQANSGLDISNLEDGVYTATVSMYQFGNSAHLSMSNGAVDHTVQIVVRDGRATLYADFKPMLAVGVYGSLMKMWVYQGATPVEAYEATAAEDDSGARTEADYLSWQSVDMASGEAADIEGTPSEEPSIDNQIRPKRVAFKLPYLGAANDYNRIYVRVYVDAMAMISEASGQQNAIMTIDYSTLTKQDVAEADQTAADAVVAQIAALPATSKMALSDKEQVQAARTAYTALTDDQKVLAGVDVLESLETAEARISQLEAKAQAIHAVTPAVTLSQSTYTYDGKAKKPRVTVKVAGKTMPASTYTVSYAKGRVNAGTYKVTVTMKNGYSGTKTVNFTVAKAKQALKAKTTTKTMKAKKLKKRARTVKALKVTGAKGALSYKKTSGSKKLTVNKKTGTVTVKKGAKKGTYKVKVKVSAKATANYKAASKTVTVKVKVK